MMLRRGCWPRGIWGAGFILSIAFPGEATAASGCSAAVHSPFFLFCPALPAGRRWDCSTGSASSLLHWEKRAPAFNSISHCLCSGEYRNMNPLLLSPSGLFMLLSSLPPTPNTSHVLPGLSASYLKQVTL